MGSDGPPIYIMSIKKSNEHTYKNTSTNTHTHKLKDTHTHTHNDLKVLHQNKYLHVWTHSSVFCLVYLSIRLSNNVNIHISIYQYRKADKMKLPNGQNIYSNFLFAVPVEVASRTTGQNNYSIFLYTWEKSGDRQVQVRLPAELQATVEDLGLD